MTFMEQITDTPLLDLIGDELNAKMCDIIPWNTHKHHFVKVFSAKSWPFKIPCFDCFMTKTLLEPL